ncbi:MAG: 5'-methylthioadenosine/adenosylhomocysteine nucleosidase [Kiritimatiellae bacterium]|jgi:adenosylhomocysteine nucleosidase|nr:5'-methylthioadenosine/adenosylhomocysteine nucleosidase [Kiritimatiellia bacterium]
MKIGLLAAMSCEREQIANLLDNRSKIEFDGIEIIVGSIGNNEIALCESGIGKVNSAFVATNLIKAFSPDVLISTGCAGGIDPSLRVGDVVVSERCVYHDVWCGQGNLPGQMIGLPRFFECDGELVKKAVSCDSEETRVIPTLLATGDQFVDTDEAREKIKRNFPDVIAVEMESAALAHICHLKNIPFISFRVISDVPGETGNNTQVYENFWATMADKSFGITRKFLEKI